MHRVKISAIHLAAPSRPPGYLDTCFERGRLDGEYLVFEDADYEFIWRTFSGKPPPEPPEIEPVDGSTPLKPTTDQSQWPVWARKTAQLAKAEDSGLGDTIARIIGGFGGNAFKIWFKATFGADCGCEGRQERLNWRFPYGADSSPRGRQRKKARLLEEKQ
jgi:hypothetical protein